MFVLNKNIVVETFEDGDAVLYDRKSENTHIFNKSAYEIFSFVLSADETEPDRLYEKYVTFKKAGAEPEKDCEIANAEDFNLIFNEMIAKNIVLSNEATDEHI